MRNRKFIFIILALIGALSLALYVLKAGGIKSLSKRQGKDQVMAPQSVSGHEGHGGATPQAKPEETKGKEEQKTGEEAPTVEIPTDKQQMIGVKTTEVAVRPLQKIIRTVGRIEYDEKRLATVNTKFEGWIERLHVDYTGKYVKKGEPLAEIYSPELVATQQEFLNLLKWSRQGSDMKEENINKMLSRDAAAIIEAAKQRLRLWDISDDQIGKIEES